jgi:hypothetical protein
MSARWIWRSTHPTPSTWPGLQRCAARPDEAGLATALRLAEALAGRGIDDRFFAAFTTSLRSLIGGLPGRMPLPDRHALALLQLTRILFLYFVEAKGWLAGRPRFLREEVDRCLAARRSLHRDLLRPLFFGTLNRPYGERGALARRFGPVPSSTAGSSSRTRWSADGAARCPPRCSATRSTICSSASTSP